MNLKGSVTERNLKSALTGESLARNKYTFYAMQAKAEGKPEIAELFEKMAMNESFHARAWFNFLNGDAKSSEENLLDAAKGENTEWRSMYPEFAKIAREEGFESYAQMFERVAEIEKDHERQFLSAVIELKSKGKLDANVAEAVEKEAEKKLVKADGYRCQFCGAVYDNRPDVCPVCQAIGSFENCTYIKEC